MGINVFSFQFSLPGKKSANVLLLQRSHCASWQGGKTCQQNNKIKKKCLCLWFASSFLASHNGVTNLLGDRNLDSLSTSAHRS